ncbi:hypothetical protein SELMODRAFT_79941 [Selaginella moellendorffii]|uniref:Myb-like domain-containing protein n=1 Tax=Selaginella moellendorffii TaxID=88036 RepID=D8QWH4_SELML|nr:hypothetical protein SELMODRAFT_79941 [Selaginella moellendorffii]
MSSLLGDGIVIPLQQPPAIAVGGGILDGGGGGGGGGGGAAMMRGGRRKEERIPQWGFHETKEFIAIRAEFEREFTQTKRNKTLWELIAGRMKDKGFRRSADQCKCKWKNLVNRYKGKEISEPDNGRQCPFYEELDAIFKERSKSMLMLESDGLRPKKRLKKLKGLLSDEETDDEDDDEESDDDNRNLQQLQPFQHHHQEQQQQQQHQLQQQIQSRASSMQEVLEEFFQQQQRNEEQWRVSLEQREMERRAREHEWRECMEKLEQERALREQAWWEREEQRRLRDEVRSRKRDELVEAVLRKVIRDDC